MIPQHQISISTTLLHIAEDRKALLGIYVSKKYKICPRGEQILKGASEFGRKSGAAYATFT